MKMDAQRRRSREVALAQLSRHRRRRHLHRARKTEKVHRVGAGRSKPSTPAAFSTKKGSATRGRLQGLRDQRYERKNEEFY
jgi:hypothetical protein